MVKGEIVITRTEYILKNLRDLYAMSDMPDNSYSADYIAKTLFKPKERTEKLLQKIQTIIDGRNINGRTKARAA